MNNDKKIMLLLKNGADVSLVRMKVSKKMWAKLIRFYQQIDEANHDFLNTIFEKNVLKVKYMLENSPVDVNKKVIVNRNAVDIEFLPLAYAASKGYNEIVELILKHPNTDINMECNGGLTALGFATGKGHIEIVEMLLKCPWIEVNTQDPKGNTPLIYAAQQGFNKIVELLLKCPDININLQDDKGHSAFMWAVHNDHEEVIRLLYDHPNLDINLQDYNGFSILMNTIHTGNEKLTKLLL